MRQRLLVVEDDTLQQMVMKAALEKHGYDVEVASDGLMAVGKLRAGGFDLALIDYHMPGIDGFASAWLLRDLMPKEDQPKLIAVTAAADSLISRDVSGSTFDAVVSKPLDLPALLTLIDTHLQATAADRMAQAAEATWREFGLTSAPVAVTLPHPTPAQEQMLRCYFDLTNRREPEAVLLLGPEEVDNDILLMRAQSPYFTLPFIDVAGRYANADAAFSPEDHSTWDAVAAAIIRFGRRRRLLAHTATQAVDLETRLLVCSFLSGHSLPTT